MPVRDEGGEVTTVNDTGNPWDTGLITTEWKPTFIFLSKKSVSGVMITPFKTVYTRQRETYSKGQILLVTDWMTAGEYIVSILKNGVS